MNKKAIAEAREVWECHQCGAMFEPTTNGQCPRQCPLCPSGDIVCIKANTSNKNEQVTSGLGWAYDDDYLKLFYEIDGMAEDDNGQTAPAGMTMKFGPLAEQPDIEKCERIVKTVPSNIPGLEGKTVIPITSETFHEKGYDE